MEQLYATITMITDSDLSESEQEVLIKYLLHLDHDDVPQFMRLCQIDRSFLTDIAALLSDKERAINEDDAVLLQEIRERQKKLCEKMLSVV